MGFATAALFSPDGRVLATSGNSTIRLWDLKNGSELHAADGHAGEVNTLAVSADGRIVASGSWDDRTVRLWDRDTGRQRRVLVGHTGYIRAVVLSPDGKMLFSGAGDGTIRQWDVAGGEQRRVFTMKGSKGEKQQVFDMRLVSDGRTLVAISVGFTRERDTRTLWVWDVATGTERVQRRLGTEAWAVGFAPDGKTFFTFRDGKFVLEDVTSGRHRELSVGGLQPSPPWEFSSDGQLLAMRSHASDVGQEAVAVFDVATGSPERILATGPIGFLAFSPDRRYLATAGRDSLRLWELATGREVLRRSGAEGLHGHHGTAFISSLVFTPDGRSLVTGMPDTTILLWSLAPDGMTTPHEPDAETMKRWWNDLGGDEAPKGYATTWALASVPREKALAFLNERLRPTPEMDGARVRKLIDDLDSAKFAVRQRAFQELEGLGEDAGSALRSALDNKLSLEVRKRLEDLLSRTKSLHAGATLRGVRAVEVLERLGAVDVLMKLAKGAPEARLTREAKASLDRLARRPPR